LLPIPVGSEISPLLKHPPLSISRDQSVIPQHTTRSITQVTGPLGGHGGREWRVRKRRHADTCDDLPGATVGCMSGSSLCENRSAPDQEQNQEENSTSRHPDLQEKRAGLIVSEFRNAVQDIGFASERPLCALELESARRGGTK